MKTTHALLTALLLAPLAALHAADKAPVDSHSNDAPTSGFTTIGRRQAFPNVGHGSKSKGA